MSELENFAETFVRLKPCFSNGFACLHIRTIYANVPSFETSNGMHFEVSNRSALDASLYE